MGNSKTRDTLADSAKPTKASSSRDLSESPALARLWTATDNLIRIFSQKEPPTLSTRLHQITAKCATNQIARTLLGLPPAHQRSRSANFVTEFKKRQWLIVILCGTIMVPSAFYVASILEGAAFVEYTRLATLSWLSFFAAAVLNALRK